MQAALDVATDHALAAQIHDRSSLGFEQLPAQTLIVERPLLDAAVVVLIEARREPVPTEAVQPAQSLGRVFADPFLLRELLQSRKRSVGRLDPIRRPAKSSAAICVPA